MSKWSYISTESFHVIKIHQKTLFQLVEDKKIKYKSDSSLFTTFTMFISARLNSQCTEQYA